ncbi:MAG TPA: YraN family protein [Deltaproteobacteria bacterium]|nr:YraN family protein [Deltaproteobacteria bacterium]
MTRPPEERSAAGREAEEAVCGYLRDRGMEIVARNFRGRGGEVDIVAREGDTLAFVEVRYRGREDFGRPEESIDRGKRLRVVSAARGYLGTVSPADWREARFDVAAVEEGPAGPVIRYYPNAFDARGKIL